MKEESEKYNQVLALIRKSKPVLKNADAIEKEVIRRISAGKSRDHNLSEIADVIFSWVYVGWVRRTLVTASVILVLFFAWQQTVMMKQISYLSRQDIMIKGESLSSKSYDPDKGIILYRLSGRRLPAGMISLPEEKMNQLLDSVNILQTEYRELLKLIREDPELRKLIEEKLEENVRSKTKL